LAKHFVVTGISVLLLLYSAERTYSQEEGQQGPGHREDQLTSRQKEILRGVAEYAPWDCPDRWLYELGSPQQRNALIRERMLTTKSWIHFLAYASLLEWNKKEAESTFAYFLSNLPKIESGKVRQNVIFLVALAAADANEKLKKIFETKDEKITNEDRTDAGCALAMLGDEEAATWFEKEFKGSECMTGRPVFEFKDYIAEEEKETREVTLSYRVWETLFRRPYFRRLEFLCRSSIYSMQKSALTQEETDNRAQRFLSLFPAKWPGHPGCDDFAVRMLNFAISKGDLKSAYLWAQRATLLPDQDCKEPMLTVFTALAESQLSIQEIDDILALEDGKHNREFLEYTRFLALAKEDKSQALDYFDKLALSDKHTFFAHARLLAAKSPAPEGIRKGMDNNLSLKILIDYPKRSKELAQTLWEPKEEAAEEDYLNVLTYYEQQVALRTRLARKDSITLDVDRVARQYRAILELYNLEKMEKDEPDVSKKADLRYKQASIVYNNEGIFFPVWAKHHMNFGYSLNQVRYDKKGDERLGSYVGKTFHLRRAYDLFASLLRDFPDYKGKDNVLFSLGNCYAKLMDYRPACGVDVWSYPDSPPKDSKEEKLEYGHRRVAELFRKIVTECPDSTLSDDAERAVQYREKMARLLRLKREKKEKQPGR
jgi:hypothetical protein